MEQLFLLFPFFQFHRDETTKVKIYAHLRREQNKSWNKEQPFSEPLLYCNSEVNLVVSLKKKSRLALLNIRDTFSNRSTMLSDGREMK